jgi:hypothetical protein
LSHTHLQAASPDPQNPSNFNRQQRIRINMSTFLGLGAPSSNALTKRILFGCAIPGLMGAVTLIRPGALITQNNFPVPTDGPSRRMTHGALRFYAVRNIVTSLIGAVVCLHGDPKLVGKLALIWSLAPSVDALVAGDLNGNNWGKNWPHWACFVALGGTGAALLSV